MRIKFIEWGLIIAGAVIIFISFIWDYLQIIVREGFAGEFLSLPGDQHFYQATVQYQPVNFAWSLFIFGEVLILFSITMMVIRIKKSPMVRQENSRMDANDHVKL
ncbi:MAG: hypothetical protein GTO20_10550 [Candidatus Aminicenantes bacterium]|nr:hypothetical protein [Candidatus Aminicenantes bacterium]